MPTGLAADLGYAHSSANPLHRLVRWGAGTRPGGWVFSHTLRRLDDVVVRLSRGRHSAPGLLAGLAVLEVTTTGRRSGQRRTSHLIATPYAGALALLGTNFGQASTPAWVLNLEADPRATSATAGPRARWWPARRHPPRPTRCSRWPGASTPATSATAPASARRGGSAPSCWSPPDQVPGRGTTGRTVTSGIVASAGRSMTCTIVSTTVSTLIQREASYVRPSCSCTFSCIGVAVRLG